MRITLRVVAVYQYLISPLLGPRCRFEPSCSAYTAAVVARYGCVRGLFLGFRRLLRCCPGQAGGYDPPPL